MEYSDIIETISKEQNLPYKVVDKTYKAFWHFIRSTISNLPLKLDIDEETFNSLRTNFNIPSLGKLTCTFDRVQGVKKRLNYIKNLRER